MPNTPVILITGASSGIGAATARRFARGGWRVALTARRTDRLEVLAAEIRAAGGSALPLTADVSRIESIQAMVQNTLDAYGQIDALVNNAGFGRLQWLDELDPIDDIQSMIDVDLAGTIQVTRQVLPHMIARRQGHIVNLASVAGLVATPTYSVYAACKFGQRGFTEALRREVRIYGIHVSAIYPGGTRTEFTEKAGIQRKTKKTTPARLRLEPEAVAEAVWEIVQRPKRGKVMPSIWIAAAWFNAFFPALMDWVIERRFTIPERLR